MLRVSIWILLFVSCLPYIELCDDYDYKTFECKVHSPQIDFNRQFNLKNSLKEIGYDLYFHKKITYGVKITNYLENWEDWNCYFSLQKKHYIDAYLLLEGKRIIDSSLWCFDYLGSLVLEFYKINHLQEEKLDSNFLNYEFLILIYRKNELQKTLKRNIKLKNLY